MYIRLNNSSFKFSSPRTSTFHKIKFTWCKLSWTFSFYLTWSWYEDLKDNSTLPFPFDAHRCPYISTLSHSSHLSHYPEILKLVILFFSTEFYVIFINRKTKFDNTYFWFFLLSLNSFSSQFPSFCYLHLDAYGNLCFLSFFIDIIIYILTEIKNTNIFFLVPHFKKKTLKVYL